MSEMEIKGRKAINAFTIAEGNQTRAAEVLGVPRTTYMGWLRYAIDANLEPADGLEDIRREVSNIYKQHEFEVATIKNINRTTSNADDIRHIVFNLPKPSVTPPEITLSPPQGDKIAFLQLSDIHMGEIIDLAINKYNKKIAASRISEVVAKFVSTYTDAKSAVLVLGGDNLSGSIHPDLAATNDGMEAVCMMDCLECFRYVIKEIKKHFKEVKVVAVYGNHSRQTPRPWAKASNHVNWDWLMYCLLEREFLNDSSVQFHIANQPDIAVTVNGFTFLVTHGDYFPGGSSGKMHSKIARMRELVDGQAVDKIDYLLLHHFHQSLYISNPGVIVNAAICGVNEYALYNLRVKGSPAGANAWCVEHEYGVVDFRMLKCQ